MNEYNRFAKGDRFLTQHMPEIGKAVLVGGVDQFVPIRIRLHDEHDAALGLRERLTHPGQVRRVAFVIFLLITDNCSIRPMRKRIVVAADDMEANKHHTSPRPHDILTELAVGGIVALPRERHGFFSKTLVTLREQFSQPSKPVQRIAAALVTIRPFIIAE